MTHANWHTAGFVANAGKKRGGGTLGRGKKAPTFGKIVTGPGPEPSRPGAPPAPIPTGISAGAGGTLSNPTLPIGFGSYGTRSQYGDFAQQIYKAFPDARGLTGADFLADQAAARAGGFGGGGTGGGGGTAAADPAVKEVHEFEWKDVEFSPESGQAPGWWVGGRVPKNVDDASDPRVNFMMTMNAMIPYMSPEDQRNAAAQLYAMDANNWSEYKPEKLKTTLPEVGPAGRLTTPTRRYFGSRQRSTGAINMLNQLREATVGGNRFKISPDRIFLMLRGIISFS